MEIDTLGGSLDYIANLDGSAIVNLRPCMFAEPVVAVVLEIRHCT